MSTSVHIEIREATAGDLETLFRFNMALSDRSLSREGFENAVRANLPNENNRYLIALVNGVPAGVGSCHVQWLLHHAEPIAEVQEMYVEPAFRSQGIGALLLHELEEFARSRGANQVELSTNRRRLDAHRFYGREGYNDSHLKWVKKKSE